MAIAWHPYFNLPSGDRTQARVQIPGSTVAEVDNYDNVFPTGKLLPVAGNQVRPARRRAERRLGTNFYDDNWNHLDWERQGGHRASHRPGRALWRQHRGPVAGDQDHPDVRAAQQRTSWPSSTSTTSPTPSARSGRRDGHRHGDAEARAEHQVARAAACVCAVEAVNSEQGLGIREACAAELVDGCEVPGLRSEILRQAQDKLWGTRGSPTRMTARDYLSSLVSRTVFPVRADSRAASRICMTMTLVSKALGAPLSSTT